MDRSAEEHRSREDVRGSGESRLPRTAPVAPLFVWTSFFAMLAAAHWFIASYSSAMPFWDDLEWSAYVSPISRIEPAWWWSAHNEHRLPLPRAIGVALMRATSDFRSGMYFQVYLLGAVALAMILLARKLRGRTEFSDAFFPLLWLTWGNSTNLLMLHQLSIALPTAITSTILMLVAASPGPPRWRTSLAIGLCVVGLPLCGGPGVTTAPAIILWLCYAGWMWRRSDGPGASLARWMSWGGAAATVAVIALYFHGFERPEGAVYSTQIANTLLSAWMFLANAFGPAAKEYWPWSGFVTAALSLAAFAALVQALRRRPDERVRAAGILAVAAGVVSMAISTGIARGGDMPEVGFAKRYVTLPSPILCCVYFTFCLYGPPVLARWIRAALCAILIALVFYDVPFGRAHGEQHRSVAEAFASDVADGVDIPGLADRHWIRFYNDRDAFESRLRFLHEVDLWPRIAACAVADLEQSGSRKTRPSHIRSSRPVAMRRIGSELVQLAHPECELFYALVPGARTVAGRFGIHPNAYEQFDTLGVRFTVELRAPERVPQVLFERVLRPEDHVEDRGIQSFSASLPEGAEGELVQRTAYATDQEDEMAWAYWSRVEMR